MVKESFFYILIKSAERDLHSSRFHTELPPPNLADTFVYVQQEPPETWSPRWVGGHSTPSWAASTNTPPVSGRSGCPSSSSSASLSWSWPRRAFGATSSRTSRATHNSRVARTSATTISSLCRTSACGACSSSSSPPQLCLWPCTWHTENAGIRGPCWPPTALKKLTWRPWRKDVFPLQVLFGGPTPAACSSGSSLRGGSCTRCTLSTTVSTCPGSWSVSSGPAPTRWTASSPGPRRRLSSPSSWWRLRPSAWCWTWPSCSTSSSRHSWGARTGQTRGNTPTRRAWRRTTRRTRCCCPPQIRPATRPCAEEQWEEQRVETSVNLQSERSRGIESVLQCEYFSSAYQPATGLVLNRGKLILVVFWHTWP